ncbi:MAG: serine/threonine-protein kinase [Pseudomonadota bacterium]
MPDKAKETVVTDLAQDRPDLPTDAVGDELPAGTELFGGAYVIEKYLNSGGFGITYLALDSLGRRVVIKECFPSAMCYRVDGMVRMRTRNTDCEFETILELFEKEARALAELNHPYIVGVHQIFKDNGTAYMALDFVEGRDLLQVIEEDPGYLQPEDVHQILLKCLDAVGYIHERDILHRDISPDNILLDGDLNPVMIDFGAARESATRVSRVLSKVLTVKDGYSPQEFYLQGSKQEYASDLYALAATFYHIVSGEAPPSSHLRMAAAARNATDPLVLLEKEGSPYPDHFLDSINTCLSIFPADRLPSAQAWRDAIDVERRRQILLDMAEEDRDLEEKVQRLVAEYHRSLRAEAAAAAAEKAAREAPEPKPDVQAPPRRKARRLDPIVLSEPMPPAEPPAPAVPEPADVAPAETAEPLPARQARPRLDMAAARAEAPAPVPQAAPETGEGAEHRPRPEPLVLDKPPAPPPPEPAGFRKLLSGTKHLFMGPRKTRLE